MARLTGPSPVFAFELLTTSRRWQVYAARSLFVGGLLVGLAAVWSGSVAGKSLGSIRAQAEVGQRFLRALAATQLALALLAAPAATAGAICLDRARGTLAHVLVTDLTSAEIILGKLAARLVPVVGMVLCGVPFLALGTLLGGIEPFSVLWLLPVTLGAAILGCTLALTLSIWGTRMTEVVLTTYAVWLIAVLLPPTWWVLRTAGAVRWPVPYWVQMTSPVLLIFSPTLTPGAASLWLPARFLGICLALSAVQAATAAVLLRPAAAREPDQARRWGRPMLLGRRLPGPSLDANPVLWREWQARRPTRWGVILWLLYAVLAMTCTAMIVSLTASSLRGRWVAASFLNAMQVAAGMLLLSIFAASSLAEERVAGSLDVLLATPLSTRSIVWGKWWGTFRAVPVLAVPPGLAAAAVAWHHGHWTGVILVVGLVVAYGAALTSLGLALATWVPRLGRAVGLCVAAHVGVTVGWVMFIIMLTPHTSGLIGPGLASFSPFLGVMLPTLEMQMGKPSEWLETVGWVTFWIVADLALAALLLQAVLMTFNRCLGRVDEGPGRNRWPATKPGEIGKACPQIAELPWLSGE
jgi:ABC-type transport system involved in multi-copper enzyme maturation permease subunit